MAAPQKSPTISPSDAAKEARRLAFFALEEGYDTEHHRYKAGWSDRKVAEDAGLSEEAVKKLREEFFGPLGEPVELTEIRDELAALKREEAASRQAFDERASALTMKLKRLCDKNGWTD